MIIIESYQKGTENLIKMIWQSNQTKYMHKKYVW